MPTVDDPHHADLESDVCTFLAELGYDVPSAVTYHAAWPRETTERLAGRWSPTALYLRGRADRLAIHIQRPDEFEWEAKTCQSYADLAFELTPFLFHVAKARLGARCLYAFRNVKAHYDAGFWCAHPFLVPIREIRIPERTQQDPEWLVAACHQCLPGSRIQRTRTVGGSDDPFAVIDASVAQGMPHWKSLIAGPAYALAA